MLALILFYVIIPSDVHIEVSVEKSSSVEFSRTDKPGGKVGAVTVKVTIQNLADEALAFDQKKIDISVLRNKKNYLGYTIEPKGRVRSENIKKGEIAVVESEITFHTFLLEEGAKLTIVANFDGKKAEKEVVVKRK